MQLLGKRQGNVLNCVASTASEFAYRMPFGARTAPPGNRGGRERLRDETVARLMYGHAARIHSNIYQRPTSSQTTFESAS